MEIKLSSTSETKELATKLAENIKPGAVFLLFGDLGSGKTTFVRYVVEALAMEVRVQSPTFVIVRRYDSKNDKKKITRVFHVDLYRLISEEQVNELGLSEMLSDTGSVMFIEWPEFAQHLFPNGVKLHFETISENERKVIIEGDYV